MTEYWIRVAGLASAAVTVVCFVIAVIVIYSDAVGKARGFGVLGLSLVFASTILDPLNRSLGAFYGTESVIYETGSILVAVFVAAGIVLAALGVVWARKARQARGNP